MDKADPDDSTPAPDRKAEPDREAPCTPPAVTKAPAPVRSIGGFGGYVPPKPAAPTPKYVPTPPLGFVAFAHILSVLASNAAAWGIPPGRLPGVADLRGYARVIEAALTAGGRRRAAVILSARGDMVWAPAGTWFTYGTLKGNRETAAFLALNGEEIRLPFPITWGTFDCYPMLPCRTLALMFGAITPPGRPPQSVLRHILEVRGKDWRTPQTKAKRIEAQAPAPAKKMPVTAPALWRWWSEIYLPEHPDPDRRPRIAEQHAAAIAYFSKNKPPTHAAMRALRADPGTPEEWRSPGRLPKSE